MIFAGDVAIAAGDHIHLSQFPDAVARAPWVINMEGPINHADNVPDWGTCSSPDWRRQLDQLNIVAASLANNHIADLPNGIADTVECLRRQAVMPFGAGSTRAQAAAPIHLVDDGIDYLLVGFGWRLIGCKVPATGDGHINPLHGVAVRDAVGQLIEAHPRKRVVPVLHWNYELEHYPQPAHRVLAKQLIELGAWAVIGHHPHVAGPVERYRERSIAYSVGNLAFSHGRFFGGRNRLPSTTFDEIALELGRDSDRLHHMRFAPPHEVRYLGMEDVSTAHFSRRPDFDGFSDRDYADWFRHHRVKKRLLPIYAQPDNSAANLARDTWMAVRQRLVDGAARARLKKMHHAG